MTYVIDPPATRPRSRPTALGGLAILALIATVVAGARYLTADSRTAQDARTRAEAAAARVAIEVDAALRSAIPAAEALARDAGARTDPEPALHARLEAALAADPRPAAAGVAYEPGAFRPDRRLFAPMVQRGAGRAPRLRRIDAEKQLFTSWGGRWVRPTD